MGGWISLIPLLGIATNVGSGVTDGWRTTNAFKLLPADDRCVVAATFMRGDQTLDVALESHPAAVDYELRLFAAGDLRGGRWIQGKYSLGGAKLERDWVVAEPSKRVGILAFKMETTRAAIESAGSDPLLEIEAMAGPGTVRLAGMHEAISQLDACSAALLTRWGYAKEFQLAMERFVKPKRSLSHYASSSDYPRPALLAGAEGETYAIIDVDAKGRASNCRINRSSGTPELDRATCLIVTRRARYEPARNAKGETVAAPYYLVFRWEIAK